MPCHRVSFPDGSTGFVCTRGGRRRRCVKCGLLGATQLCDGILPTKRVCSAPLCLACAVHPTPGTDLCPACDERSRAAQVPAPARHLPVAHVVIYTASYSYRGADRVDITRQGADRAARDGIELVGRCLAPSWETLTPALRARREAQLLERQAREPRPHPDATVRAELEAKALALTDAAWASYRPRFIGEMRASLRTHRNDWWRLLVHGARCCRGYLTLVCFCVDPTRCHRTIAGELLALASRGRAVFAGECERASSPVYTHVLSTPRQPPSPQLPLWG